MKNIGYKNKMGWKDCAAAEEYIADRFYYPSDRIITMDEVDRGLSKKSKLTSRFVKNARRERKNNFNLLKKIEKLQDKHLLYKIKEIMINELRKPYYDNAANILEFIDINTHMVEEEDGRQYKHIENLCIWQNGFYQFNSFNLTTPAMRTSKNKNLVL